MAKEPLYPHVPQKRKRRGIRIPISLESWRLIIDALEYLGEKPILLDHERRARLGKLIIYIKKELELV